MRSNQKGVTLVELVVGMAITALLLSAVVIGLTQYSRTAQFRRQNETARTLFHAVQLQLTKQQQAGQLSALQALTQGSTVPSEQLHGANGEAAPEAGRLCYLCVAPSDYEAYLAGTLSDAGKQALYALFEPYVYDKSVLRAAICVELDPYEALVYSVLYSDRAAGFCYAGESGKTVSIATRGVTERKSRMVGYYGVGTLSQTPPARTSALQRNALAKEDSV